MMLSISDCEIVTNPKGRNEDIATASFTNNGTEHKQTRNSKHLEEIRNEANVGLEQLCPTKVAY